MDDGINHVVHSRGLTGQIITADVLIKITNIQIARNKEIAQILVASSVGSGHAAAEFMLHPDTQGLIDRLAGFFKFFAVRLNMLTLSI